MTFLEDVEKEKQLIMSGQKKPTDYPVDKRGPAVPIVPPKVEPPVDNSQPSRPVILLNRVIVRCTHCNYINDVTIEDRSRAELALLAAEYKRVPRGTVLVHVDDQRTGFRSEFVIIPTCNRCGNPLAGALLEPKGDIREVGVEGTLYAERAAKVWE